MKVLITGAQGQLGRCLTDCAPAGIDLVTTSHADLDLADQVGLMAGLSRLKPDFIINTAAYTDVDRAEVEIETAKTINETAVKHIADFCSSNNCRLIQLSTDFVFDGKQTTPYQPESPTRPINVYGRTKLASESAALARCKSAWVIRSGWLYSPYGHNFVNTMLRLAVTQDQINVVDDQIGGPTCAINLSKIIWKILDKQPRQKVLHYSDAGAITWYEFAVAIFASSLQQGLITNFPGVKAISSEIFNAAAVRPAYSVLDSSVTVDLLDADQAIWYEALRNSLAELKRASPEPALQAVGMI